MPTSTFLSGGTAAGKTTIGFRFAYFFNLFVYVFTLFSCRALLPAVYCAFPCWSRAAAVHTPADFLSRAVPWLWLLTTAYFSAVLQRAHPWAGVLSDCLNITQLLSASVRPTLYLQMSSAATAVRDEFHVGALCLVGE